MSDWRRDEMPRAFLVKNKLRRPNVVDDNSHADPTCSRDAGGERPILSRCSTYNKNTSIDELTRRTDAELAREDRKEGSKHLHISGVVDEITFVSRKRLSKL